MPTRSWIFPSPTTSDVPGVTALRVEAMAGSVAVEEHDADHVHIAVDDVSGPAVRMTLEAGRLLVSHAPGGLEGFWRRLTPAWASGRCRLRLFVPKGTAVSVSAAGAEVVAAGLTEDVELSTTSGRIAVSGCRAAARVFTRSGDVITRDHQGDVHVTSGRGRSDIVGDVPLAELSTGTADVWVATTSANSRTVVTSLSGAVNVRVPQAASVRVKATRLGGSATVDGRSVDLSGGRVHTEGNGSTVAEVKVSMATGSLHVRREGGPR